MSQIEWLQTDPPLFRAVSTAICGEDVCKDPVYFEGCTPSTRFDRTTMTTLGPSELFALTTHGHASVRWRDREIGTLEATRVTFVPP